MENKLIVVIHIGKPDEILNALLSLIREKLYLYFTEILNCDNGDLFALFRSIKIIDRSFLRI